MYSAQRQGESPRWLLRSQCVTEGSEHDHAKRTIAFRHSANSVTCRDCNHVHSLPKVCVNGRQRRAKQVLPHERFIRSNLQANAVAVIVRTTEHVHELYRCRVLWAGLQLGRAVPVPKPASNISAAGIQCRVIFKRQFGLCRADCAAARWRARCGHTSAFRRRAARRWWWWVGPSGGGGLRGGARRGADHTFTGTTHTHTSRPCMWAMQTTAKDGPALRPLDRRVFPHPTIVSTDVWF